MHNIPTLEEKSQGITVQKNHLKMKQKLNNYNQQVEREIKQMKNDS